MFLLFNPNRLIEAETPKLRNEFEPSSHSFVINIASSRNHQILIDELYLETAPLQKKYISPVSMTPTDESDMTPPWTGCIAFSLPEWS